MLLRRLASSDMRVSITGIAYDSFGRVIGFQEDLNTDGPSASSHAEVSVIHDREPGNCANTKYTVMLGDRQLASGAEREFSPDALSGHFGFKASDIGGIMGIGSIEGDFVTNFSYDSFGRRQLANQAFSLGGIRYEITYPKVTFDDFGRLSGYQAVLKRRSRK